MRVSTFGLGYVGCVTAACLAKAGHQAIGVDINPDKVAMISGGMSPLVEPGLGDLLGTVTAAGNLRATTSTDEGVSRSDLAMICVGTPSRDNGKLDVDAIRRVAEGIGRGLQKAAKPYTVVLRSTVLPGTTESVLVPALRGAGTPALPNLSVAVNPEFMREGSSLRDFAQPPLTLVGSDGPQVGALLREMYAQVDAPFVQTSIRSAEMAKYVSNAFHALKITFANEIGDFCEAHGVDASEVMRVFLLDRKLNISEAYLCPGCAFGGSCLPKDLRALAYAARSADLTLPVLSQILPSNDRQIQQGVNRVLATRRRRIGVLGLAFKPGTDDLRESPMVLLVETLIGKGCDVRILDRSVSIAGLGGANRRYIEEEIPHIASLMCETPDALLAHAEVLVVANSDEQARQAIAAARPDHLVIHLSRGGVQRC
jgi:GDP-mannose 6-dehydrogenase